MPPATKSLLAQLNKRDQTGNEGADSSDNNNPVTILGLIITTLALLVAILSYQNGRFPRLLSSLLPSPFVNFFCNHSLRIHRRIAHSGISYTPLSPDPFGVRYFFTHNNNSKTVVFLTQNNYFGAGFAEPAGAHSTSASYPNDSISRMDIRRHHATTATRPSLAAPPIRLPGRVNTTRLLAPNV